MQIIEEVCIRHGLTALLQEKPFAGYNGSGKHNNWSISTDDGTNLINFEELSKLPGGAEMFPVVLAAIIKAVDEYGDLMRMSIATPGNDLRLGGYEAPSNIVTLSLGESLTDYLEGYMNGSTEIYKPTSKVFNMGALAIPPIEVPAEDRNRTAFFAYTQGNRFEFRAAGSSQNMSLINCVLATITCKIFTEFSDKIEAGATPRQVAQEALRSSFKVIFNGNCYDPRTRDDLKAKGLWAIESSVDALCRFTTSKNIALFEEMKVFTEEECRAQESLLLQHYIGTVEIEANCMIDMINQYIIPSCKRSGKGPLQELRSSVRTLNESLESLKSEPNLANRAELSRELRLEIMSDVRSICDMAEAEVPAEHWLLATYNELLYIDENYVAT
jgi:glutamine synthetase